MEGFEVAHHEMLISGFPEGAGPSSIINGSRICPYEQPTEN
jgi:hypothetical protein